jgi:hypothetical protein
MKLNAAGLIEHIKPEDWGKDHKSTILYAEARAVDHRGKLPENDPRMRKDGNEYPTRIRDGIEIEGHDDYDCLTDAIAAGFLTYEDGIVKFTDAGWAYAHALRRERAARAE